jgi:hypothetical protein
MDIKLLLNFNWKTVFETENIPYSFPQQVNQFMRQNYNLPSIYRWKVFKEGGDNPKIYIGETSCLCPDRINGYLNPGPSQFTNQRMKDLLNGYLDDGWNVHFEHLPDLALNFNDLQFNQSHLNDKYKRRLIEMFLIVYYKSKGYSLLNN